jgi:hypothetical protein
MKKRLLIAGAVALFLTVISSSLAFDVGRWGYYWNLATQGAVGDSLDSMLVRLPGLGLYVDGDSLNIRVAKGLVISGDSVYWDSTLSTTVTGTWLFNSNVAMAAKLQANAIFLGDSTEADSTVLTKLTILGFIGDTATVLRGDALDSALRVWNDSIPGIRVEMIDSIMRVLSDTLPNYANLSDDESITGKWNFGDTTEFTVIALINGSDTSWFYTATDTTYWQTNGNDIKIGSSSIVVPSTGPVTITSMIVLTGADVASNASFGGAFHEDTTVSDSEYVTQQTAGEMIADSIANDCYVSAVLITANQSINSATWTQIAYNSELADWGSDFNTTNNEFTAPDSGVYLVSACALIDDNGGVDQAGYSSIAIYRNDSLKYQGNKLIGCADIHAELNDFTPYNNRPFVGAEIYCNTGDQIQIYGYQDFDTGGGLIIADSTWLTIRKEH